MATRRNFSSDLNIMILSVQIVFQIYSRLSNNTINRSCTDSDPISL